jgi:hypothetical protein
VNIAHPGAALVITGRIGLVDVTNLEGLRVENFAVNLKLPGDVLKFFFL